MEFWEPCLLPQVLSESFRMDYCRLWQALIKADMKRVQKYSRRLGAGDMYPLFACVVTARSWEAVNRGIDKSPVSAREVGPVCPSLSCALPFPWVPFFLVSTCSTDTAAVLGNPWQLCSKFCTDS